MSATTVASGPTLATTQLAAPTGVSLAYGSVAGSIAVTYTGSAERAGRPDLHGHGLHEPGHDHGLRHEREPRLGGQPHGPRLRTGLPGHRLLRDRHGERRRPATSPRPPSTSAGPQNATSQLGAPGTPTVASSTTVAGAITATFTASCGHRAVELHGQGLHQRRDDRRAASPRPTTSPARRSSPLTEGTAYYVHDHRGATERRVRVGDLGGLGQLRGGLDPAHDPDDQQRRAVDDDRRARSRSPSPAPRTPPPARSTPRRPAPTWP